MTLALALAVGVLVGAGSFLVLERDLHRMTVGTYLLSSAAILFVMSAARSRGVVPVHPLPAGEAVSDPLVQALAVTAIVIGFAVTALLCVLVLRVAETHGTLDVDDVAAIEEQDEAEGRDPEREEA